MGQLVERQPENVETTDEQLSSTEDFGSSSSEQPVTEVVVPEKYQGKTTAEIIQMHQEAEKLLGRQSSEVGELRKVVDTYIQGQTQLTKEQGNTTSAQEEEIDFFSEPEKAIQQQISKHPKILEAEQISQQYKQETAKAQLQKLHPDMAEIVADKKFQDWVTASKVRQKLFQQADKMYDYETADELFNLWKDRVQAVQQTANSEKQERKQAVKNASVGTTQGSTTPSSRKIYRRSDIMDLMKTNPNRYLALSDEILQAYAEKRVR
jgi:hypothetical protein